MKEKYVLALCLVCLFFSVVAADEEGLSNRIGLSDKQGPHAVGFKTIKTHDAGRAFILHEGNAGNGGKRVVPRPISIALWYPAHVKSGGVVSLRNYLLEEASIVSFRPLEQKEKAAIIDTYIETLGADINIDAFRALLDQATFAERDAQPLVGPFPLILYAPSISATPYENAPLFEYLASHGYIVVAVPALGVRERGMWSNFAEVLVQIQDIEFALNSYTSLSFVDMESIGVLGYSFGGWAVDLLVAKNELIDAVVTLDGTPGHRRKVGTDYLEAVSPEFDPRLMIQPHLEIRRSRPPKSMEPWADSLFTALNFSDAYYLGVDGLKHRDFASLSTHIFLHCADDPGRDRAKVDSGYKMVARMTSLFFDVYLHQNASAEAELKSLVEQGTLADNAAQLSARQADPKPPIGSDFVTFLFSNGFDAGDALLSHVRERYQDVRLFHDEQFRAKAESLFFSDRREECMRMMDMLTSAYPEKAVHVFVKARMQQMMEEKDHALENYEAYLLMDNPNKSDGNVSFAKQQIEQLRRETNPEKK